jgi:4'-phosphopantetheinyl transferase EntD
LITATVDPSLQRAIDAMAVPGILVAHRLITPGDEDALLPEEAPAFASSVLKVRRASGAARTTARALLEQLGARTLAIPRGPARAPVWPEGIVGSLAHDAEIAIAAVGLRRNFLGIGVDVEPAEPLPADLLPIVATPAERQAIGDDLSLGRLLFSIKEAVYKAVHPLDGVFLDHHDVEVSLGASTASARNGRKVSFRACLTPRLITLAYVATTLSY